MGWSGQSDQSGKKDFERSALDTRLPIMDVGNGSTMDRERNDPCQRAGSLINQPSTRITKVHFFVNFWYQTNYRLIIQTALI